MRNSQEWDARGWKHFCWRRDLIAVLELSVAEASLLAGRVAGPGLLFKRMLWVQGYGVPSTCLRSYLGIFPRDLYTRLATGLNRKKKKREWKSWFMFGFINMHLLRRWRNFWTCLGDTKTTCCKVRLRSFLTTRKETLRLERSIMCLSLNHIVLKRRQKGTSGLLKS